MLQIKNASLTLGTQEIFDDISFQISDDQKVGLVGRNGSGKSTLLKVIAGQIQLDSGQVAIERNKKIAYMPQEIIFDSKNSVLDEAVQEFSEDDDIEHVKVKAKKILTGLGFDNNNLQNQNLQEQPVSELSVGMKMRLVLAKLLLQNADFYLFDEPTNHLDIVTKEWFYNFLKNAKFGFILVSHDRFFLEKVCEIIIELEKHKSTSYYGNFTFYLDQKQKKQELIESTYKRQKKEIDQKQKTIDRFKASASKAKMAQSMVKQIAKIELVEPESPLPSIKLRFPEATRSGSIVLKFDNLKKTFQDKIIFQNISGEIKRGDKVGLVAPNGTGKTTLFNLLIGKYPIEQGKIEFGHNVKYTVFEQDQKKALNPKNTIIEEVLDSCSNITEAEIRGFLGAFLFSSDDVYKKISVLSGGELNRVAMVKVLLQRANFLLLDEPTNHLDIYSKDILLQALQQYDGTLFIVSHDHDFLNNLTNKIFELTPNRLYSYEGNYESYLDQKKATAAYNQLNLQSDNTVKSPQDPKNINTQKIQSDGNTENLIKNIKREQAIIESKISQTEQEITKIFETFGDFEYDSDDFKRATEKIQNKQKSLKEFMAKWEMLLKEIENITKK